MPITPKPVVATEVLTVRLPKATLELLDDYCRHLGGASDRTYVVAEALRLVINRDRSYRRKKAKDELSITSSINTITR